MKNTGFEAEMALRHAAIHDLVADKGLMTVLHIGDEATGVAVGTLGGGSHPPSTLALALGSQRTAREYFKHSPPSPLEMENAIATVEDEVMRARALFLKDARESRLYTTDAAIREIAHLSGVSEGARMQLSLEAMERTFDRLAAIALGRPASADSLPASNTFAATLLILREFMHHLQFSSISIE